MNWMAIAVTVSSEGEEAVAAVFYELGCNGVSVELEPPDGGGSRVVVKGYFPEDERLEKTAASVRAELLVLKRLFPHWMIESEHIMVKEDDWADAWKKYFKALPIGRNFLIKPSWEESAGPQKKAVPSERIVIEIDPGMAFGTGTHATTALCLEAIERHVGPGDIIFDIGTGSGILALAAAKLGADVQAGDIDPLAVKIARENVKLNGLEDKIRVNTGNLGEVFTGRADVVIANIIADVIIDLLPQLPRLMKPDGLFLASGIIDTRGAEVVSAMEQAGLCVTGQFENAGWILLEAVCPVSP